MFPLNFIVYGWNDIADHDIDRLNPRKDSWLFGARGSAGQLAALPRVLLFSQLPFAFAFCLVDARLVLLLGAMAFVNFLYNAPRWGFRTNPPLELFNQLGYLLILPLSSWLNGAPLPPAQAVGYLVLFCTHSHLCGEIMDVVPDRAGGRRTTATFLGIRTTKLVVLALVVAEGIVLCQVFIDYVLGGMLFSGAAWLVADLFFFGEQSYTRRQFALFGLGINLSGVASMAWVWHSASLLRR